MVHFTEARDEGLMSAFATTVKIMLVKWELLWNSLICVILTNLKCRIYGVDSVVVIDM